MEEPKQENFEDYEEFLNARITYGVEKSMSEASQNLTGQPAAAQVKEHPTPAPVVEPPYMKDPEIAAEIQAEKEKAGLFMDIASLGEGGLKDSPAWDDPFFRRGLENKVAQFNLTNDQAVIVIPREEDDFGQVKETRPENMLFFKFDSPEEKARILRNADNFSGPRFSRIWSALRQAGYSPQHGRPTFHATKADADAEETRHPYAGLSQAEYEKAREKEGAKKW